MPESLPLSSSSSHQFPPPDPPDQAIGGGVGKAPPPKQGWTSHISHHLPWPGAASQPSEWTSYMGNHQSPPKGVWQQHHGPPMSPPPATNGNSDETGSDNEPNESSAASIKFHVQDIYHESYGTSHDPAAGWANSGCNIPRKWELFQELGQVPKPTETQKTNITSAYTY